MAASLKWMYFLKKVRGSGEGVCALEIIAIERMMAITIPRLVINVGSFNSGLDSINTRFYHPVHERFVPKGQNAFLPDSSLWVQAVETCL
jgi:hypothetical protein